VCTVIGVRGRPADALTRDSVEEFEEQLNGIDFQIHPRVDAAQLRAHVAEAHQQTKDDIVVTLSNSLISLVIALGVVLL
jgi:hypothetical protein